MTAGDTLEHSNAYIHPSASIEDDVVVGERTRIWASVQVRRGARIGADCVLGRNVFVDLDVMVGDCVKVQNNASLFEGVVLDDGVFVGPHVIFTNDRVPRSVTPAGRLKTPDDWTIGTTHVKRGAALGAGVVVVTGISIGEWAMIGAGATVIGDVPDHALVVGNPGRVIGYVSATGVRFDNQAAAAAATVDEAKGSA